MATVIIPTPLRKFTNAQSTVQLKGETVAAVIEQLVTEFPDLKKHLLDEQEAIRSFVNVFLGEDDIRDLDNTATGVNEKSVISIIPAIAGGRM
jgi:molybdopterin synthase sulfur carrier subunit